MKFLLTYFHVKLFGFVLRYIIPYRKESYITATGRIDGMGVQVLAVYSAMVFAYSFNKKYLHTKLKQVCHNDQNDVFFEQKIEDFFSFGANETDIEDLNMISYRIVDLRKTKEIINYLFFLHFFRPDFKIIFLNDHYQNYSNRKPEKYLLIKDRLRDKFYTNPQNYTLHKEKGILNIALHIRRGDVSKDENANRFTSNIKIREKLDNLILVLKQKNIRYKIHIYSEGKNEDFSNLTDTGKLHLNDNIFETFYNLVEADVLIMAKSSFSYAASLLSNGIIIYEPFSQHPLKQWFKYEKKLFLNKRFQGDLQKILNK